MARVDVTVRGAGIFGLSVAWACVQRGASVRVVDPKGPGAGASGGIVGALAPHVPENWQAKKAFQFDSLMMAEPFWSEVSATGGGAPGYARLGRIQPLADDRLLALAQERANGADTLWQGKATWRVTQDLDGFAPPSPTGWYVYDTLTARIHPRRACDALARAITAKGGEITTDARDEGQVLWATGWQGLRDLTDHFSQPIGDGVKGQAVSLRFSAPDAPQLFADSLHFVPHEDGTLAIGSTSERHFDHPTETDDGCEDLLARARALVPALRSAPVVEKWAGVRPRARSRAPLLGAWPGRAGHFVANGGFKIGFGMAPKVAQIMADLLLDGHDAIPEDFRLTLGAPRP